MATIPDIPDPEKPPRRPFEGQAQPEPIFRSPEFMRFVWLAGVLAVVGIMAYSILSGEARKVSKHPAAAPPAMTAEARAARDELLHSRFEGSLADTRNGEGFAETQGYGHLLQLLAGYPAEEVEKLATRKLDWAASRADPDAWRGEFVWTRGVIAHRWAERLKSPVSGIEDVYRVILTDGDGSEGVIVDMLEEPPPVGRQSDPVDVRGIFYRTVRYPTAGKKSQEVEAPYLLVKTMRPVGQPPRNPGGFLSDPKAMALVGMALVILVARLLIYVFQRRSRRPGPVPRAVGFRNMFAQRIRDKNRTAGPRSES